MASCMQEWPEPIVRVQALAESGLSAIPHCYVKPPRDRPVVVAPPAPAAVQAQLENDQISIPVVDLGDLLADGGAVGVGNPVTEAVASACREWGFFQVVNHGVRPELMRAAREAWRGFFRRPLAEKQRYANSPRTYEGYGSRLSVQKGIGIERLPVLADGVFIGMMLNHSAGDGTAFWHFFNTWSEINRVGGGVGIVSADLLGDLSKPPPVFDRWFLETCPVPIPLPFPKLEDIVRRFQRTPVKECFFTFSVASVKKLKARANNEMAGSATATISSLQAVLAHFWRAVCRAWRLTPEQSMFYSVVVGCRGRVNGIPPAGYLGNALVFGKAEATAGEIEEKGLGWTAWLLNRAVVSFDEATMRESLERWVWDPDFTYMDNLSSAAGTALVTGSSPRFDVFGNDFGWGKPLAVRSGAGNKADGKATVFEGPERRGSISLDVCIAPDALERLVADQFMDTALSEATYTGDITKIQARCYTAASVPPEKLIIGQTLTGLGVFFELTNPRGGDYRRVHVKAHVGDVADIQIAYKHAMQLAIQICKFLNFENVMFLENQFLVTAQGVVKTRQSSVNKTALKLAKQARQSISQQCCLTCNTESHLGSCPVLEPLRNRQWGDYSLISVRCF